ncbi:MAG: prolyl oligopeptidase family serine peptidase, partial [Gemmataceae bacterium]
FRVVRLDPRARTIDLSKPVLLRAEQESNYDSGFYTLAPGNAPKRLVFGPRAYTLISFKKNTHLLNISTFSDYPDLHVTDAEFHEIKKLSNLGEQTRKYIWGTAELVNYKNADGVPLQGILLKPDNFDPAKKYPMIVYIYERLSQNLHRFVEPRPGTSINPSYYVSNGYLVLMPDIVYTVGYPGQSAVKCVLPAIERVVDRGYVNENAIGLQGHSWGGYQTAYLITQTTRFKAASAGAPVTNMTSAYGGIRWGTGLPRQFQYERTQSRIGGSLWAYPTRFIENSPVFMADRVQTPLLMLHNDKDEAVPWQEGIQFYLALRRLDKEVYLFNYPGEAHGLRQRKNQLDYTIRLQQFFDHHLKGVPKPLWMVKGEPYAPAPGPRPVTPMSNEAEGEE